MGDHKTRYKYILGYIPNQGYTYSVELPQCCYRVSVKALVLDDSCTRFLAIREASGVWDLPGGGVEHGSKFADELRREIEEEMGLAVEYIQERPSYFLTAQNGYGTYIANVLYETTLKDLNFTPSDECTDIRFVTSEEAKALPANENVRKLAELFDPKLHMKQ